jgi:hypothetical protein
MKNIIIGLCGIILLTGCDSFDKFQPTVTVDHKITNVYPNLPDLEPVKKQPLDSWNVDVARDMSVPLKVKNTTECLSVKKEKQDDEFWAKCGEHPPLEKSNIYLGFDQDNWNKVVGNFAKLKTMISEYESRMEMINKQRAEWREQNKNATGSGQGEKK